MKSQISETKLDNLIPDNHNANKGSLKGMKMLDDSLRKNGAGRSILIDRNGKIIAGNKTTQAAVDIGLEDVIIVKTKGDKLVAVQREDLDLDDPATGARELAYLDNFVSYFDFTLDPEVVSMDMGAGFDFEAIGVSLEELGEMLGTNGSDDWDSAFGNLPEGDKAPFQQMTFTLHDSQAVRVQEALRAAQKQGDFNGSPNQNGNGNALAFICEAFLDGKG